MDIISIYCLSMLLSRSAQDSTFSSNQQQANSVGCTDLVSQLLWFQLPCHKVIYFDLCSAMLWISFLFQSSTLDDFVSSFLNNYTVSGALGVCDIFGSLGFYCISFNILPHYVQQKASLVSNFRISSMCNSYELKAGARNVWFLLAQSTILH